MADLSLDLCGVQFKNPIIAASGTFGFGREYDELYDISALGGISVKGLCLDGTGAGFQIFPAEYGVSILTLPFGGFLTLGCLIALTQYAMRKSEEKKSAKKEEVK